MAIVVPVSLRDTHWLVPAKYAEKSVFEELQLDLQVIHDLSERLCSRLMNSLPS
jgi:hypothetical protein